MINIRIELPQPPDKESIIDILNKIKVLSIQNCTIKEQQEIYVALQTLAFLWFRTEDIINVNQ